MRNLKLVAFALLVGCTGSSSQVLTGHVAQTGFPSPITEVRVVRGGAVVASSPVAADGSFQLAVQPGRGLTLEAIGAGKSGVIFPRTTGTLDRTFVIHAAGPAFDLGAVRFVGNASTTSFAFKTNTTEPTDCHDGQDSTGATCVDDEDDSHGTCADDDANETEGGSGNDTEVDEGDAVADHNFPADGCTEDGAGDDSGGGGGSGSDGSGH